MENTILSGVHQAIGNTPMVHLSRLTENLTGNIFAKLEYVNPGFSKKDRIALQIIEEAEEAGILKPNDTVVELTSGNTGTGLAIVCGVKGYKFVAVMSKGNSMERARMMQVLGAEVVLVDQAPGSPVGQVSGEDLAKVEEVAQQITKERNAFRADQFHHIGNLHAHEFHTGEEIWKQTNGKVDVFLDFAGSGGTFTGCAKTLKKYNPNIRCYLVEPYTAPFYSGKAATNLNHKIQGGGYSMDLPLLDKNFITDYIHVTDEEATQVARELARKEGIFAGFSSGANVAAALQLLKGKEKGANIVLTINDSGLKYLSTDLYE
ncbi:PLP-dependent cysteine synthase family protein [Brevibacillus porteri]|uniref:Cysteine synthase n=1 Tax=Brevibacillus porteri TaxID=2126350 RepID=A0ABX5FQ47_9BACL|nr:cysteine synthase family protein [Brevibacillus porteri]MED1801214.1 cysteine synthase family protein [Brevibacillus porteri]MED2134586.1 cysteine synthase family protein [Brevibacillus porteri]MED2744883.1 cysteine synthase family protein [Brevibacillus porteri]MED2813091.1 cysteine synthase family protein [Brevibacillus porteri]MED2896104.1 cysteine synthase family protein [Brevibacillus porteri]